MKTTSQPDCYTRQTLKNGLQGRDSTQIKGLLHLYDAIREALTEGVLVVTPSFPIFTVVAAAKMESVTTKQTPFQSAALILIFTPIDVLRQQSYTFVFDPLGANRPQSGTSRVPTINKTQQNALAAANAWAETQMC